MPQRSAFGLVIAHGPSKHRSWNHRTRTATRVTTIIQLAFASKLVKENRHRPESFNLWMWRSMSRGPARSQPV